MNIATAKNVSIEDGTIRADIKLNGKPFFFITSSVNGKCDRGAKVFTTGQCVSAEDKPVVMDAIDEILGA